MMVIVLSLVLLTIATWAAWTGLPRLIVCNATLMLCVPMVGAFTTDVFCWNINMGGVFYAVLIYGLALQYIDHGVRTAADGIGSSGLAIVILFSSVFIINFHKDFDQFDRPIRIIGTTWVTFWLTMTFFLKALVRYDRMPRLLIVPILMLCAQVLSSLLYYPLMFGIGTNRAGLHLMVATTAVKAVIVCLSVPFLAVFLWLRGRGRHRFHRTIAA